MKTKSDWERTLWDGNLDLHLTCWRKKFGRGHVSVGCGDFLNIVHSFGPDSERSYSSTRWRKDGVIGEEAAKAMVDRAYSLGLRC